MTGQLQGQRAVVTGGVRGIGRGIADAFAAEGADVAVVDLDSPGSAPVAELLTGLRSQGGRAHYAMADVADEKAVDTAAADVLTAFGRVDVLVNNAGIFTESPVASMPVADFDRVLAVNLRGTFLWTRALLPQMLTRGSGRIINVASQLAQIGGADVAHYAASKGAILAFTKSVAREVAAAGVLVNAIAPGPVETDLLAGESEAWRSAKLAELPIGRFASVGEVVPTVVLLAGAGGTYYVGATLGPSGGDVMQ